MPMEIGNVERGARYRVSYRDSGGLQPVETICGGKNSVFRRPITVCHHQMRVFLHHVVDMPRRYCFAAHRNVL